MALVPSGARTASRQIEKANRRPETSKRKRGRPPIYRPEFTEQVTNYCLLGATNEELGRVFGVDERTINRWLVTKPEFCQAVKDGREVADAKVANSLYRKALNGDTAAAFIWLKNRRPDLWRDRKELSSTSKVKVDERVDYALSPEARQLLDETLAELGQGSVAEASPADTTGNGAAANRAAKH